MKFVFIHVEKAGYPVRVLCRVLEVSPSGYYAWVDRPASARTRSDAQLAVEIAGAHSRSRGTYGSPRVHAELRARGIKVGKKRVARLMQTKGIAARRKRRFRRTTDSNHTSPIAPNVVARDFAPEAANKVWVTDVTYVWTDEGWLFLAVMLDLYARRAVGWATSAINDTDLALAALGAAVRSRRPAPGLVHHSDRGSPYASAAYRAALDSACLVASMSRTGDCWDNAVAESFFATLKKELINRRSWPTKAELRTEVFDYIEVFYNRERRHSTLGQRSPAEYEKIHLPITEEEQAA